MSKVSLEISKDDAGHVNKLSGTKKLKLRPNRVLCSRLKHWLKYMILFVALGTLNT